MLCNIDIKVMTPYNVRNIIISAIKALGVSITDLLGDQPATSRKRITSDESQGGTSVKFFWYVCDGEVEEYKGQDANWDNSVIVFAKSPEDALVKVAKYHLGMLERIGVICGGKSIEVIS